MQLEIVAQSQVKLSKQQFRFAQFENFKLPWNFDFLIVCVPAIFTVNSTGGVEDSTFEASKKKKVQGHGQGPTFRRQAILRQRTGRIKAKDRGHNFASCLLKEKNVIARDPHIFCEISRDLQTKQ